jgi:uncharacterized protein YcaQ
LTSIRTLTPRTARRLAITRQRLAGARPSAGEAGIMEVMRDLGSLQLDPISAVARSHLLVLFSRLGPYDPAVLDKLLWKDRRLFEYWAHCASIVLTEDFPIFNLFMRGYPLGDSPWSNNVREWIGANGPLKRRILSTLRRRGPLPGRYFAEDGTASREWVSTGWTSERNISRMLDYLWMQGRIMVAGRAGLQKLWDLSERCLPEWTPRERLTEQEVTRRAAERALRALGVARERDIQRHFIRGRYQALPAVLREMERQGTIERVQIRNGAGGWSGDWFVHAADIPLAEGLARGEWEPRTALLSPFDNLICDRARTRQIFDFDYTIEIYTPAHKREFGYYVLPILHGERLIGRLDPVLDRANERLLVKAVHAEEDAPRTATTARAVRRAVEELAGFLGARAIEYPHRLPAGWERIAR